MTTVTKIEHVGSGELGEECPYCKYDDAHKEPCIDCGEMHTPTPESFSRWLHRNFTNRGAKAHENEVKMYATHAKGGEHKEQIHNLRSALRSGQNKKLRSWGKGRPKKAITKFLDPDAITGSEEHSDDCPLCDAKKKIRQWYDNPKKPDQWHDDKMVAFNKFKKDHDLDNKVFHKRWIVS